MSKRALQINAFVLSLTPVVEKNRNEGSSSKKEIGFLHQQKLDQIWQFQHQYKLCPVGQWLECPALMLTYRVLFPAPAVIVGKEYILTDLIL